MRTILDPGCMQQSHLDARSPAIGNPEGYAKQAENVQVDPGGLLPETKKHLLTSQA